MPDRDPVDAPGLDAAFAVFTAEVATRTRAPGADRAVDAARRRRAAVAGVTLIVMALLVGVVVHQLGLPGHRSVHTVARPDPLPAPRALTAAVLDEATAGWTRGWQPSSSPVSMTDLPCVPFDDPFPAPLETATSQFRVDSRVAATHLVRRYATVEDMRTALPTVFTDVSTNQRCTGEYVDLKDELWTGGESVGFALTVGPTTISSIVVLHENELAVLRVAGPGQLPERTRRQIVLALLADLRT